MNMGSNSTLLAVASIPPAIWQQDKAIWEVWATSRKATFTTRQKYRKIIADFYSVTEKAILQVTEQDLSDYAEASLCFAEELAPRTIKQHMNIIRAYWKFAHKQASAAGGHPMTTETISRGRPSKLNDEQRAYICAAWAQGIKQRDLAQQFNVTQAYISKLVDGIPKVRASSLRPKRTCVDCKTPLRYKTRCETCNRAWRNAKEKKRQADLRAANKQEAAR